MAEGAAPTNSPRKTRGVDRAQRVAKRAIDIAASSAGLAVSWPVLAGIAVAIKLDSPGPVIYRGVRAGKGGKPFKIYKFRSMVVNAEAIGETTTAQNDPRVTKTGAFLRKYKLDELPQLLNVLKGEMSFVGPRPEVYEFVDEYDQEERKILDVRPGITDYASVEFVDLASHVGSEAEGEASAGNVYRERILKRKNRLRLKYVEEQSLANDAKILVKTIQTVVGKAIKR